MKAFMKIAMVLFACLTIVSVVHADRKMKTSGFLSDYSGFKPGPKDGAQWVYIKEGVDFKGYTKVMVDRVTFFLKDDAKYKGIQPEDVEQLTEAFDTAVRENIGKSYPLVDTPGPDVLRIRVAITDLVPNNPGVSAVTTVMPIGLGVSMLKKGLTGEHTGVGETGMEMEVLDSSTNDRLAAAIHSQAGSKLSGVKKWGAAEEAFKFWTERIRIRLDEYHGKQ